MIFNYSTTLGPAEPSTSRPTLAIGSTIVPQRFENFPTSHPISVSTSRTSSTASHSLSSIVPSSSSTVIPPTPAILRKMSRINIKIP